MGWAVLISTACRAWAPPQLVSVWRPAAGLPFPKKAGGLKRLKKGSSSSDAVVQERVPVLQRWLDAVLLQPAVADTDMVQSFLLS